MAEHSVSKRVCSVCGRLKSFEKRAMYCSRECAATARSSSENVVVEPDGRPKMSRVDEMHDDAWVIQMTSDRVKTEAELLKACKVDQDIWEVEKTQIKSYEVTYVPPATRTTDHEGWIRNRGKAVTIPMFAIKCELIRKDAKKIKSGDRVAFLKGLAEVMQKDTFKFSAPRVKTPIHEDAEHSEIAVVCSSDQHLCETVRPEDANGVNTYNSIVCANRLWEHVQKVKTIMLRHMKLYRIEKIVALLLGDVVNGSIHPEYLATNDLTDPAAVLLGARLMHMFYAELATLGLPVEVEAVHGNHARLTAKVPTKRQAHTNLDWQLYEILKDKLASVPGVEMNITTAQIGMKKIFDWNYLFEHGINVGSGAEEAFEDRLRALFDDATFRQATGYTGASFDQIVIGNMHKPKYLERTVVNGSYIGQNELGQSWRLKPIKAQQLMWGVSRRHVRTWQYQVDLTHIVSSTPDNPFSEYAYDFIQKNGLSKS